MLKRNTISIENDRKRNSELMFKAVSDGPAMWFTYFLPASKDVMGEKNNLYDPIGDFGELTNWHVVEELDIGSFYEEDTVPNERPSQSSTGAGASTQPSQQNEEGPNEDETGNEVGTDGAAESDDNAISFQSNQEGNDDVAESEGVDGDSDTESNQSPRIVTDIADEMEVGEDNTEIQSQSKLDKGKGPMKDDGRGSALQIHAKRVGNHRIAEIASGATSPDLRGAGDVRQHSSGVVRDLSVNDTFVDNAVPPSPEDYPDVVAESVRAQAPAVAPIVQLVSLDITSQAVNAREEALAQTAKRLDQEELELAARARAVQDQRGTLEAWRDANSQLGHLLDAESERLDERDTRHFEVRQQKNVEQEMVEAVEASSTAQKAEAVAKAAKDAQEKLGADAREAKMALENPQDKAAAAAQEKSAAEAAPQKAEAEAAHAAQENAVAKFAVVEVAQAVVEVAVADSALVNAEAEALALRVQDMDVDPPQQQVLPIQDHAVQTLGPSEHASATSREASRQLARDVLAEYELKAARKKREREEQARDLQRFVESTSKQQSQKVCIVLAGDSDSDDDIDETARGRLLERYNCMYVDGANPVNRVGHVHVRPVTHAAKPDPDATTSSAPASTVPQTLSVEARMARDVKTEIIEEQWMRKRKADFDAEFDERMNKKLIDPTYTDNLLQKLMDNIATGRLKMNLPMPSSRVDILSEIQSGVSIANSPSCIAPSPPPPIVAPILPAPPVSPR